MIEMLCMFNCIFDAGNNGVSVGEGLDGSKCFDANLSALILSCAFQDSFFFFRSW